MLALLYTMILLVFHFGLIPKLSKSLGMRRDRAVALLRAWDEVLWTSTWIVSSGGDGDVPGDGTIRGVVHDGDGESSAARSGNLKLSVPTAWSMMKRIQC